MRLFLINGLKFFIVFIALALGFQMILINARDKYLQLPSDINKVFLGNSTVEYGIDDSCIQGAVNFAQNAEPIDIMYAKLRLLHRHNPQIDTVFVELDDITLYNDGLEPVISNAIYFDAFTLNDWIRNIEFFSFDRLCKYFSHAYDIIKIRPLFENHMNSKDISALGVGGYAPLYRNKLADDINRFKQLKDKSITIASIPQSCKYYFQKTANFCKENGITIIFFNTPRHKYLWRGEQYSQHYWAEKLNDIRLIDCTQVPMPDSCFSDMVHLNHNGAKIFSNKFNLIIREDKCEDLE